MLTKFVCVWPTAWVLKSKLALSHIQQAVLKQSILNISDTWVTRSCSLASSDPFTIHGLVQEQGGLLATRIEGFLREVDALDLTKLW